MEQLDVIRTRHSVRSYAADEVDEEKLNKVLTAAILAPTAANRQAFRVLVVKTRGRESELKKIYAKDWFVQPPLVLAVCSIPAKAWVRGDGKNYGDVDAAIVMDHIILSATDQGLGTCWIGAFNPDAAKSVLGLEPGWEPIVFTPLGYPKDTPVATKRRPREELVAYRY